MIVRVVGLDCNGSYRRHVGGGVRPSQQRTETNFDEIHTPRLYWTSANFIAGSLHTHLDNLFAPPLKNPHAAPIQQVNQLDFTLSSTRISTIVQSIVESTI
jgi:hypothetical protein